MYSLFIVSLLGLCAAAIASFIAAYRLRSLILMVFVPIIATCGSFIYFSYVSVLGYPVELQWKDLPNEITVIYFHISNKESITLWLFEGEGKVTRLVRLPYEEGAEDVMEQGRERMGKGAPMTLKKSKSGKMGKPGEGEEGEGGDGEGGEGEGGEGRDGEQGEGGRPGRAGGWRYKIDSFGEPIPGGALPPK